MDLYRIVTYGQKRCRRGDRWVPSFRCRCPPRWSGHGCPLSPQVLPATATRASITRVPRAGPRPAAPVGPSGQAACPKKAIVSVASPVTGEGLALACPNRRRPRHWRAQRGSDEGGNLRKQRAMPAGFTGARSVMEPDTAALERFHPWPLRISGNRA